MLNRTGMFCHLACAGGMYLIVCITVVQAVECTDELDNFLDETDSQDAINVRRMSAQYLSQKIQNSTVEIAIPLSRSSGHKGMDTEKDNTMVGEEDLNEDPEGASIQRLVQLEFVRL